LDVSILSDYLRQIPAISARLELQALIAPEVNKAEVCENNNAEIQVQERGDRGFLPLPAELLPLTRPFYAPEADERNELVPVPKEHNAGRRDSKYLDAGKLLLKANFEQRA
jgi:hypothetical protein